VHLWSETARLITRRPPQSNGTSHLTMGGPPSGASAVARVAPALPPIFPRSDRRSQATVGHTRRRPAGKKSTKVPETDQETFKVSCSALLLYILGDWGSWVRIPPLRPSSAASTGLYSDTGARGVRRRRGCLAGCLAQRPGISACMRSVAGATDGWPQRPAVWRQPVWRQKQLQLQCAIGRGTVFTLNGTGIRFGRASGSWRCA
jgi:hypothetical protein